MQFVPHIVPFHPIFCYVSCHCLPSSVFRGTFCYVSCHVVFRFVVVVSTFCYFSCQIFVTVRATFCFISRRTLIRFVSRYCYCYVACDVLLCFVPQATMCSVSSRICSNPCQVLLRFMPLYVPFRATVSLFYFHQTCCTPVPYRTFLAFLRFTGSLST